MRKALHVHLRHDKTKPRIQIKWWTKVINKRKKSPISGVHIVARRYVSMRCDHQVFGPDHRLRRLLETEWCAWCALLSCAQRHLFLAFFRHALKLKYSLLFRVTMLFLLITFGAPRCFPSALLFIAWVEWMTYSLREMTNKIHFSTNSYRIDIRNVNSR